MNEKFTELINLMKLGDIKIIDSHEVVNFSPKQANGEEIQIKTEQAFLKDDPVFQESIILFRPKYTFTFLISEKVFFKCEYIISVSFTSKETETVKNLLEIDEVKKIFLTKQLNRTLWSVLRGVVMDAFNRHSLRPVVLPWII